MQTEEENEVLCKTESQSQGHTSSVSRMIFLIFIVVTNKY